MAMLTPSLQAYQRNVLQMRQSSAIDFPAHVHLETMAQCNAACNFCPYPGLERKGTVMDDALIAKVVNDLADIPRLHTFQLSPFKVNEPFLDKRLFDLLDVFTARLPNAKLTLTSNASPITLDKLQRLAGFSNLDYLWISFNDHRQAEYESTMQLPYRRTIERLQMIHKAKAEGWLSLRVVLSRVGDGTAADLEFRQWVEKNYPLFSASIFPRGEWIGQAPSANISSPPRKWVACAGSMCQLPPPESSRIAAWMVLRHIRLATSASSTCSRSITNPIFAGCARQRHSAKKSNLAVAAASCE